MEKYRTQLKNQKKYRTQVNKKLHEKVQNSIK